MSTTTTVQATRRPKWQYTQTQPTPRILNLPRRTRKRHAKTTTCAKPSCSNEAAKDGRCNTQLEKLFDQERLFARGNVSVPVVLLDYGNGGQKREKVKEREISGYDNEEDDDDEMKWRVQAEMLRAECNLLRMEKEIAVRKMEMCRMNVDKTLTSALQTLFDVRNRIREGKDADKILDEGIRHLAEKLEKLQRKSRVKESETKSCSNFDKKASLLQRRLETIDGTSEEHCVREIREMAEASLSINTCEVDESIVSNRVGNMDILRKKMEGFSKGMLLKRMEADYRSLLSSANSSAASSVSTSRRYPGPSSFLLQHINQEVISSEKGICSGRCKAVVRRIIEQVRVETEQWSQMQVMLRQVREEMEELQTSRNFWEDQARTCDYQLQSLHYVAQEWRRKAASAKDESNELETKLSALQKEYEILKKEKNLTDKKQEKRSHSIPHDSQNEMEKRVLVCQLKENIHGIKQREAIVNGKLKARVCSNSNRALSRSPLGDIRNVHSTVRQR